MNYVTILEKKNEVLTGMGSSQAAVTIDGRIIEIGRLYPSVIKRTLKKDANKYTCLICEH